MNITRLNTLNDDKVIIKKEGGNGGGDASTIEYVDISTSDENLKTNMMTGGITIRAIMMNKIIVLPSGVLIDMINHGATVDDILAVSVDLNMAILTPTNGLTTNKDSMIANGFWETYSSLPRITKEEFYHIPQDEVWPLSTQDDYKAAWNKLYPLVERYGADYINENKLSLAPWYKSLTIGDNVVTELLSYRISYAEEDSKRERILLTTYTGIEKITYTDGTIEYQSYNPPM